LFFQKFTVRVPAVFTKENIMNQKIDNPQQAPELRERFGAKLNLLAAAYLLAGLPASLAQRAALADLEAFYPVQQLQAA